MRRPRVELGSLVVLCLLTCAAPFHAPLHSHAPLRARLRGGAAFAATAMGQEDAPRPGAMSTRILATDAPCIVQMQKMMRGKVPACLQLSLSFSLFLSLSLPLSLSLSHTYYNAHAHVHIHTHTHAHTKRRACCRSRKA